MLVCVSVQADAVSTLSAMLTVDVKKWDVLAEGFNRMKGED